MMACLVELPVRAEDRMTGLDSRDMGLVDCGRAHAEDMERGLAAVLASGRSR